MLISDKKTLEVLEILKARGDIRFENEFCEVIGLKKQNLIKIKNQEETQKENHFTAQQLLKVGEIYKVDMNFLFGFASEPFLNRGKLKNTKSTITSTLQPKTV